MPDSTPPLDALLAARIADPGHYLPRHTDSTGPYEAISRWAARAVAAGLADGSLGYIPATRHADLQEELARTIHTLDLVRRELGATRTEADHAIADLNALDNRVRLLLIRPDGDRQDHETITVAELRNAINGDPAPVSGSSRRAPEAEPTGVHAWSETAGLSFVVTACTRCGIVQRRDGETGPCHGPDRLELRAQEAEPTDDELAAEIDRAEDATEAETRAHAQGYAEAVARLRDDDRYRDWWTSGGVKPDAPIRRHLADYLETVGPDGVDVETGRWPAREHAVHDALVAAKPGDVFAFDQQPGQRVLIVVAAADCAPDSTTGSCCPSCGSRYPRRIPAGEDQRCWTCWLADPGAGESQASEPAPVKPMWTLRGCARCDVGPGGRHTDEHAAEIRAIQHAREIATLAAAWLPRLKALVDTFNADMARMVGAAPKLAQGGIIRRDTLAMVGEQPDGCVVPRPGCGPACAEGHTYEASCAIQPPARAFLAEKPCGNPDCPCGGSR